MRAQWGIEKRAGNKKHPSTPFGPLMPVCRDPGHGDCFSCLGKANQMNFWLWWDASDRIAIGKSQRRIVYIGLNEGHCKVRGKVRLSASILDYGHRFLNRRCFDFSHNSLPFGSNTPSWRLTGFARLRPFAHAKLTVAKGPITVVWQLGKRSFIAFEKSQPCQKTCFSNSSGVCLDAGGSFLILVWSMAQHVPTGFRNF